MVYAENYETVPTIVKVTQKKPWPLFFWTRCINHGMVQKHVCNASWQTISLEFGGSALQLALPWQQNGADHRYVVSRICSMRLFLCPSVRPTVARISMRCDHIPQSRKSSNPALTTDSHNESCSSHLTMTSAPDKLNQRVCPYRVPHKNAEMSKSIRGIVSFLRRIL